jgi:hypothetical protein
MRTLEPNSGGALKVKVEATSRNTPSAPLRRAARMWAARGLCTHMVPSISWTPCAAQAATMASASPPLTAMGFSSSTCSPRAAARSTHATCSAEGSGM